MRDHVADFVQFADSLPCPIELPVLRAELSSHIQYLVKFFVARITTFDDAVVFKHLFEK